MARIETDPNYNSPTFSRATAATDLFKKEDVQALASAVSGHTHAVGKGLAIAALGSSVTVPAGGMTFTGGPIRLDAVANLTVDGTTTLTGNTLIGGTLTVNQASTFGGLVTFNATPTTFNGGVTATGNLVVGGTTQLQQAVAIGTQSPPTSGLSIQGGSPNVPPATVGLGYTIAAANGAMTAQTAPLRGTGSGPASAAAAGWWGINLGGSVVWVAYHV